jgi:uncharacterized protein (DUF983 family)
MEGSCEDKQSSAGMRVTVGQIIGRGLRGRCPNCGRPTLFVHWLRMHDRCSQCGLKFERDEGFFLGAMTVNYAFAALLFIPVIVAAILHVLSVLAAVILAIGVAILVPITLYPLSKIVWLTLWYAVFPRDLPANRGESGLHDA